ncbi:YrhK family protein [Radiobacillus kanasensis]|uniref:YrhK family protein n=1 Tax=Radiobacillus kanasensis TaxID=2844358 RepID=UPI001E4639AF|nr:YrhK family protein [Radiobacillus kanasensis]UFU00854.1 YrhK family protein [Radiobacillus kanasensis]
MNQKQKKEQESIINIGNFDIFFKKPYQVLYNLNDFLISIWFLIGSIMFLFEEWKHVGIWLFIIGSGQLAIRPTIRIIHQIHLKRHIEKQKRRRPGLRITD